MGRSRYPGLATPEALEQLAGVLYYPGALEAAGGQAAEDAYSALVATQWDTLGPEMRRVKNRGKGSRARLHRQQDDDRGGHHSLHSTSYLTIPGAVAPLISKQ